jgi:hypothetical protein
MEAANMTTDETMTDEQIATLGLEAQVAGDEKMVWDCEQALVGDQIARGRCVRAIRNTEAQS